jgi:hypothetical protein
LEGFSGFILRTAQQRLLAAIVIISPGLNLFQPRFTWVDQGFERRTAISVNPRCRTLDVNMAVM